MDELPPPKGVTASPAAASAEEAVAESDEATAAPIRYAGQSPPLAKMAVRRFVQKHRRMEKKAERKAVKAHGYIGVIHCAGTIKSGLSNPRGGDIGATSFVRTLEKAMADERLKAVVLAVDSPGGSATASELMGRAIQRCRHGANKPLVCYMGGVAASGGYWMAMECDRIVAQPTTITGSIGVVAGKFSAGGLLERYGVTADHTGSHPASGSPLPWYHEWSPEQRQKFAGLIDEMYELFVSRVRRQRANDPLQHVSPGSGRPTACAPRPFLCRRPDTGCPLPSGRRRAEHGAGRAARGGERPVWTRAFCHCPYPVLVYMDNPYRCNKLQ